MNYELQKHPNNLEVLLKYWPIASFFLVHIFGTVIWGVNVTKELNYLRLDNGKLQIKIDQLVTASYSSSEAAKDALVLTNEMRRLESRVDKIEARIYEKG